MLITDHISPVFDTEDREELAGYTRISDTEGDDSRTLDGAPGDGAFAGSQRECICQLVYAVRMAVTLRQAHTHTRSHLQRNVEK